VTGSLFSRDVGTEPGDIFVSLEIESAGVPSPMLRVRVDEIDEVGMIHLVSASFGADLRVIVNAATLREKYRRE
jgi:hypothetical protein